jgi:hypothetical protein
MPATIPFYMWVQKAITLLGGFNHIARFNALGADHHSLHLPVCLQRADTLQIGVETTLGDIMGMADVAAHHWFFATYCTHLGHDR